MKTGEYIKELRISKGLSQDELGKIIGVQRAAVQKWESGLVKNLKRTTIQRLANYFEVSPASFLMEDVPFNALTKLSLIEEQLLQIFKKLTANGKEKVIEYANDLLINPKYVEKEVYNSEQKFDEVSNCRLAAAPNPAVGINLDKDVKLSPGQHYTKDLIITDKKAQSSEPQYEIAALGHGKGTEGTQPPIIEETT